MTSRWTVDVYGNSAPPRERQCWSLAGAWRLERTLFTLPFINKHSGQCSRCRVYSRRHLQTSYSLPTRTNDINWKRRHKTSEWDVSDLRVASSEGMNRFGPNDSERRSNVGHFCGAWRRVRIIRDEDIVRACVSGPAPATWVATCASIDSSREFSGFVRFLQMNSFVNNKSTHSDIN